MAADRMPQMVKVRRAPVAECWTEHRPETENISDLGGERVMPTRTAWAPIVSESVTRPCALALRLKRLGKLANIVKRDQRDQDVARLIGRCLHEARDGPQLARI